MLDSIDTADVSARDPLILEAAKKLYEDKHKGRLAEGAAYSFSYLPLNALHSKEQERELTDLVNKTIQETSPALSKGLKAQYDVIQRIILDPEEASATTFMTRKQRYTLSTSPAPGNYMTVLAMLSYPFSRGSSHITSADPGVYPEIKFNYLNHPLTLKSYLAIQYKLAKYWNSPSSLRFSSRMVIPYQVGFTAMPRASKK